ncbi:MAG: hypothetical protein ABI599_15360 [Flavobacteriales bacterium]
MRAIEDRLCLQCGEKLVGRTDKKFCSDACRSLHHYSANNSPINYVRNVMNTLRRNRRILEELVPEGKPVRMHRERLLQKGFDFNYHTHLSRTTTGNDYVFVFEYGYLPLGNDWYTLVLRTEYLERSGDIPKRYP